MKIITLSVIVFSFNAFANVKSMSAEDVQAKHLKLYSLIVEQDKINGKPTEEACRNFNEFTDRAYSSRKIDILDFDRNEMNYEASRICRRKIGFIF